MHTGTSLGYTTNSVGNNWDQETLYDLLGDNSISWKIYYGDGDISQTVVLRHSPWVDPMRYFFRDVQGPETKFPKYCFIEPNYGTFPWDRVSQNDQHPLSDVFRGEKLILDVYNALRANDALWRNSLLIITYDEHGGFYDHVVPPAAVRPDNRTDSSGFMFDKLGLRVPTILASPWLDQGIISDTFDHTSLLKFVIDKWGLTNLLGNRVASPNTNTFAKHLRKTPRQTYGQLPSSAVPALQATAANVELTDNQRSLIELSHHLATRISDPNMRAALTIRPAATGPRDEAQFAIEQFTSFMVDQAKKPVGQRADAKTKRAVRKREKEAVKRRRKK